MSMEVGLGIVVLRVIIVVLAGKPEVGLAIALLGGLIAVVVFLSRYHLIPGL
jgi:uncharacterized membrane protein YkgB